VLFSGLYIPLLTFIFGLIFRGVTFEFRANELEKDLGTPLSSWEAWSLSSLRG
jgi:cytochrome bd-type quinol oxidase subunit 2